MYYSDPMLTMTTSPKRKQNTSQRLRKTQHHYLAFLRVELHCKSSSSSRSLSCTPGVLIDIKLLLQVSLSPTKALSKKHCPKVGTYRAK